MAAGSAEANAATPLRDDPICTLILARLPERGAPLASQATLSRCANRVSRPELSRMARVWLEPYIASYATAPTLLVLAVDDTEERGQGHQEHARDDGSDGGDGFLPLPLYAGLSGRLLPTILKATRFTGAPMLAVLQRVVQRLRHAWPDTLVLVRGDSPFASPAVMQWSDEPPALSSVTGLTSHAVLQALAREVVAQAKRA